MPTSSAAKDEQHPMPATKFDVPRPSTTAAAATRIASANHGIGLTDFA